MCAQFVMLPETAQGRLSREMGQAFGKGIARQFPDPQMRMAGRMQQSALDQFKQSLAPTDRPADIATKWAESMAGVPGSENLTKTVLPQYQLQSMMNLFGQPGVQQSGTEGEAALTMPTGGIAPATPAPAAQDPMVPMTGGIGGMMPSAGVSPGVEGMMPSPGETLPTGAPTEPIGPGMGQAQTGADPTIMQASMIMGKPYEEVARMFRGVPEAEIQKQLQNIQLSKAQDLSNYAQQKLPGISPNEMNDFMRIGAKYQNLDPENWFKSTQRDFTKFQNVKANFENANIPGIVSGMVRGGKYRADRLKQLEGLAKPLKDLGYEDYVRSSLVNEGLSPTEAEMVIKPIDRTAIKDLKKVPQSPYSDPDDLYGEIVSSLKTGAPGVGVAQALKEKIFRKPTYDQMQESDPNLLNQMTEKYSDFLVKNVKPDVSLLGLREMMRREKGMDWRQYNEAVNRAVDKGLVLNAEQQAELGELTNAPRDSLSWIFQGWGRWIDYLKGRK